MLLLIRILAEVLLIDEGVMFNLPEDKEGHIRLGLLIGLAFADHFIIATLIVCIVAIGKEISDYFFNKYLDIPHNFEILDMGATAAGGVIGILIHIFINSLLFVFA